MQDSDPTAPARAALIVDDVPDVARVLGLLVAELGYEVTVVASGEQALAAARRGRFDLVVCDLGMPIQSGLEVGAALRAQPGYSTVPMISVTGFGEEMGRQARASGFDAHLNKPIDPTRLAEVVSRLDWLWRSPRETAPDAREST